MAAEKTHVIAFASRITRGYVRSVGRDGAWTATWDAEKARRFTETAAAAAVARLTAAGCLSRFEAQQLATVES